MLIIADVGLNHNGDVNIAKKLIDVAVESGADAVKFQKRPAVLSSQPNFFPEESADAADDDRKINLDFGKLQYQEIHAYCKLKKIPWFASVWDIDGLKFLRSFNPPFHKIPSALINDLKLVEAVAAEKKYTFLSTAEGHLKTIASAVKIFKKHKCPFELMYSHSNFPIKDEEANLNCIVTLRERFQCKVGYSGHEVGLAVSYAAAALGISSLKRFITLNRTLPGPDHAASIEPAGFSQLVSTVRKIESAMGDGKLK